MKRDFENPYQLTPDDLRMMVQAFLAQNDDPYQRMNNLRDWFNRQFPTFDFYLEDVWNDHVAGETHFEYILRSLHTYDETPALAYDVYLNHQDSKGVWHLDEYQHTVIKLDNPQVLIDFMTANGAVWPDPIVLESPPLE